MMPRLTLDLCALASHRLRLNRETRSLRPVVYRPDGLGVTLSLPGPDWLAVLLSLDGHDVYRSGRSIVARPHGSEEEPEPLDLGDLCESLREILRTLPDRLDAGEAYLDLARAASVPSATFERYLDDVLGCYRRSLPVVPRPEASFRPSTARSSTERSREHRERRREEERASAAWVLAIYLDDEDPEPGSRVSGSDLFEYVSEVLGYAADLYRETVIDPRPGSAEAHLDAEDRLASWRDLAADEWETPPLARPRCVSRRVLFEVAAARGFTVTRPHGSVALRIPTRKEIS